MNQIIKSLAGMGQMTDQVIATDFLMNAKSGIRNYAVALTETHHPDLKRILKTHLEDAINTHAKISDYMINKGYYHAYHVEEQLKLDLEITETALKLTEF